MKLPDTLTVQVKLTFAEFIITLLMGTKVLLSRVYDTVTLAPLTSGNSWTVTVTFEPMVAEPVDVEILRATFAFVTEIGWGAVEVSAYGPCVPK